ncbi:MAG: hypothetical protein ACPG5P_09150, partial [Saprospiraceae bacterium]
MDSVDLGFSMLIGVWNGLVDMVSGLLSLPGLFARGGEIGRDALKKITENPTFYFELMLEFMDNFIQAVTTIDWGAILQEFVKNYQALKYYLAFSLASLLDGKTKLDITIQEIGYYLGYVCFSVAELFFPYAKIGKIENASDLVKLMGNNAKTFAKSAGNAGKVTVQVIAKSFENFISFLRSGKKNFIELFKRIFKGLKEWVETTIAKYTLREFSPNTLKLLEGTNLYVRRIESTLETIGPGVVGAVVKRKNTYGLFEDSGKLVLEGSEIIISKAIKSEKVYTNGISTYIFGKGLAGKNINALFYKGRMVL